MCPRNRFWLSAVFCCCLASSAAAGAEEPSLKEPVVVNGDRVEYFQEKKKVVGSGNISIQYKDVTMTCEKITVYLDTKEAIAEGNVKIAQKDSYFTGERINYNFDTMAGKAINGRVSYTPFYGKAAEVERVSEKQAKLERGYVTTCDLEKPHYRIQARQVKIYFDDKVTAKHIVFYLGNMPIMYLPYYIQPLKERTAHITVVAGNDRDWGYYALSSMRYDFSEICKGVFRVDYRTKKGLAEGIDNYYSIKGLGNGSAKFYYTHENDALAYAPSGEVDSKWRLQVRHRWDMSDDTTVVIEVNKQRGKDFIKDYFYKEYEEEGDPDTYFSLITQKKDFTTSFLVRKRLDKYFTVVERLPEYRIDIKDYQFRQTRFYYNLEASGVYLNKKSERVPPYPKDVDTVRFDAYNQLSYAAKILGALGVTPYAGTRQTYYSRNMWGDTNLIRGIFKTGVDNSIKFYRVYDVKSNLWGLDINKLRHIITPTANYYYTHQPTISPANLNQFDAIDALDTENGIRFSVENKLQTKRHYGEALKSVDLVNFIVSTDYMFRLRKNNADFKSQKFKSVDLQLEVDPHPGIYSLSKMSVDTKRYTVRTASVDLTAEGGDKWYLGTGYRYENVETGKSNLLTFETSYKIDEKWKARAYGRFELNKAAYEELEFTVFRDLHCWLAELTYNIKADTKDHNIWFIMRLKAFPDVPIGFRRTYSRSRPGVAND